MEAPAPWNPSSIYSRGEIVEYKQAFYQAVSDYGNLAKPDDLCTMALYEIFNFPSRSFTIIHIFYGINVLVYTFYAFYSRNEGLINFLAHFGTAFLLMYKSIRASGNMRRYAFVNQMRTG